VSIRRYVVTATTGSDTASSSASRITGDTVTPPTLFERDADYLTPGQVV
jgi:hypothetical protein